MAGSLKFSGGHRPKNLNPLKLNPPTHTGGTEKFLVAPEDKAAASRGQQLTGRISFGQYKILVERGYDGDQIKRWTAYHANQILSSGSFASGYIPKTLVNSQEPSGLPKGPMTVCPLCDEPVRESNLERHVKKRCPNRLEAEE